MLDSVAVAPPGGSRPNYVQRLDAAWMNRVHRSGWQGWTLLAGGEDVMDQAVLFWEEGKGSHRALSLSLRLRRDSNGKVYDAISTMPGLQIFPGSIPYPRKQVVAGEVHPLDRQWSLVSGTARDAHLDPHTRVRYFPYEGPGSDVPFSAQGSLTLIREGARGMVDEVASMLAALTSSLRIDTRLSTGLDLELLYLRKLAWARRLNVHDDDPSRPLADRVARLRRTLGGALGLGDLAEVRRYDWRPRYGSNYNPWAAAVGTGEAGWPHWHLLDMEEALQGPLSRAWLVHDLASRAPHVGDRVARIIRSTGYLLSSEERWMRLGTPSQSIYMPQGALGAGSYVPMGLTEDPEKATLVFHRDLLRRMDHLAVPRVERAEALSPQIVGERIALETCRATPECDVYFKHSVSLVDALARINTDSESDRAKILDAFRAVGIRRLRGVPVENVVRMRA
ncbi:MAG: hypothetical protein FJX76_22180 [Armatimonadetes bacterium]|nr:hypothetical protein [Armatimonadota bacterium]